MKLDAAKLAFATATVVAISWLLCSLFVYAAPRQMMTMSGHMFHADMSGVAWSLHLSGFFIGLVAWSALAGAYAWAIAALYNRFLR